MYKTITNKSRHGSETPSVHRRVRLILWVVLSVFVATVCIGRIGSWELAQHARILPRAIDLTGKQRFHAQHVAIHVMLLSNHPGDSRHAERLAQALARFQSDTEQLDQLQSQSKNRLIATLLPPISQATRQAQGRLIDFATRTLESKGHITQAEEHPPGTPPWDEQIHAATDDYLDAVRADMNALAAASARTVDRVSHFGWWMIGIELVLAILVALLIIEPAVRWIRRHEQSLADQRAELHRLAAVAQRTTNAVIITDTQRRITWVNEAFTRITGYTLPEVLGKVPGHVLQTHKTDPQTIRQISTALTTKGSFKGEIFNTGKNGREYWLAIDIQPINDAHGNHNGFMAVETDITQTKIAQLEQQRMTEELAGFFDSSLELLCIVDFEGRFLKLNDVWTEMLGIDANTLRYRPFIEFVHPADIDDTERQIDALVRGKRLEGFRNRYRAADGSWRTLEWRAKSNAGLIYGAARDITERLEMERALVQQAEHTELALASADLGTWDWDVQNQTVRFDQRYADMIGETIETLGNATTAWSSRVHPDDIEYAMNRLEQCVQEGVPYQDVQFRMRHTNGTWRWIRATGKAVAWDINGSPTRMVGTHVDVTDRIMHDIETKEASQRMDLALQAGRMGLWDWDLETGKVSYDQRWADILGEQNTDLLPDASTLLTRVHHEDIDELEQAIHDHLAGHATHIAVECRMRHKDNAWRWVRIFGQSTCQDDQGNAKRIVGIQMDVHDQILARAELAKREAVLANTARMARIGGWELELETNTLYWSEQVRNIHEVDPDYVPNVPEAIEFYEGDAKNHIRECIEQAINNQKPYDAECPFITAKGRKLWVRSVGEPVLENGRVVRLVGAFQDITEQRAQREALEESNRALDIAQTIARMGSWSFDIQSGKIHWSRQLFEIFQWPLEQGEPCYAQVLAAYNQHDAKRLDDAVQKAIEHGTPYAMTLERTNATNNVRYVAIEGRARKDAQGQTTALYGTVRDVTAEVDREAQLREAQIRAEDANRSKSEFLANMSHEIRTPMTAILGYADLLEENDKDPKARAESIATIRRNGQHLLTIINDILDISKIEAGRMTVERTRTCPHTILRAVAQLMRVQADAKGLPLHIEAKTPIPETIHTDPTRLRQILVNLIGNAIKFTNQGHVKVSMSYGENAKNQLRFDVQDTGIGMTPQQAANAFDPFMQADASVTRRFGGTGLGLPISKRLAQMLGGDITLTSTPGTGSTFSFTIDAGPIGDAPMLHACTLPIEPCELEKKADHGFYKQKPLAGLRILIMEDGEDNLRLITTHLETAGAKVASARNGRQGVEQLTVHADTKSPILEPPPFDAILTDMQMPEMDGYTAVRLLRKKGCKLPIIALTAHAMTGDREKCIQAGCDAYAPKPITRQALVQAILDTIASHTPA